MMRVLNMLLLLCMAILPLAKANAQNIRLSDENKVLSVKALSDGQYVAVVILSFELVSPDADGQGEMEVFILHDGDKYYASPTNLYLPAGSRQGMQSKRITLPQPFESFEIKVAIKDPEGKVIDEGSFAYPPAE